MTIVEHGWISFHVTPQVEAQAKVIRAERDKQYANIYQENSSDMRWLGEIGEILFDEWLTLCNIRHTWIQESAAGKPDFLIDNTSIDVKSVKRQVPMRLQYEAQITKRHASEKVDQFFFATYIQPTRKLLLLGGDQ